jgi:hypothetical protein
MEPGRSGELGAGIRARVPSYWERQAGLRRV